MNQDLLFYVILILITSLFIPRMNKKQIELANHIVVRALLLGAIVYTGLIKKPVMALLLTVVFVSLVYHLNKYKIKKTFDISLEIMHQQHKKESPGPQFEEVDTTLMYTPSSQMGTNTV